MDRNQALGVLERIYKLRDDLEKRTVKLQKVVEPLRRGGTLHSVSILLGILGGIRRYLIQHEEDIISQLMESEIQNGKETLNKKYGKLKETA